MNDCGSFSCFEIIKNKMTTDSMILITSFWIAISSGKIIFPRQYIYKKGSFIVIEADYIVVNTNCIYPDFIKSGSKLSLLNSNDYNCFYFNALIETSYYLNLINVPMIFTMSSSSLRVNVKGNFNGSNSSLTRTLIIKKSIYLLVYTRFNSLICLFFDIKFDHMICFVRIQTLLLTIQSFVRFSQLPNS